MNRSPTCPQSLEAFVKPMLGLPAWGVEQGHGSFLTFEFGEPKLKVLEWHTPENGLRRSAYVYGQWHLWIYCCRWRAFQDTEPLASSEDDYGVIRSATGKLTGQKICQVSVAPDDGRSTFIFDLGGTLETWPYGSDQTDVQWTIHTDTEAFSYRADGTYAHDPKTTAPDSRRWKPPR